VDAGGARGDRSGHHAGARHREVIGVVLADAEEVRAGLAGKDPLLDHVPDRLGM